LTLHTTDLSLAGKTYSFNQEVFIEEIDSKIAGHDFTIKYFDPCLSSTYSSPEMPVL
jgi:hypothetical protein